MQTHSIPLEIKNTKNKICANKKIKYMLANIYHKISCIHFKIVFKENLMIWANIHSL